MKNRTLNTFGSAIRAERERIGISQEELAHLCELHRTYIGSIERGERNVGLLNVVRIARALRVTPSHLLRGVQ